MASSLAASAARRAANLTRLSASPLPTSRPSSLIQRRTMAGGGHPERTADVWKDPMSPSKWKAHQFVLVCFAGWGLVFYGSYKAATRNKKEEPKLATA